MRGVPVRKQAMSSAEDAFWIRRILQFEISLSMNDFDILPYDRSDLWRRLEALAAPLSLPLPGVTLANVCAPEASTDV